MGDQMKKNYPKFFDSTALFIPLTLEFIKMDTPHGVRFFRVLYVFGFRVFVGIRPV
jgi:hypothetical protein